VKSPGIVPPPIDLARLPAFCASDRLPSGLGAGGGDGPPAGGSFDFESRIKDRTILRRSARKLRDSSVGFGLISPG
jgi:hypothetical protein